MGRKLKCPLSDLPPPLHRSFGGTRLGEVMREHFGFALGHMPELILQNIGDAAVKFLSLTMKEHVVSSILHERMLEDVSRVGRLAAHMNKLRTLKLCQCGVQRAAGIGCQGLQQLIREFPADHGPHPDFRSEWWYATITLADAQGARYGVQFTLFRQALTPTPGDAPWRSGQIYMAHAALTDVAAGDHRAWQRFARGRAELAGVTARACDGVPSATPMRENAKFLLPCFGYLYLTKLPTDGAEFCFADCVRHRALSTDLRLVSA